MAESFSAPGNNLKEQREEVLGWAKQQLADFAKSELKVQLSAKTIERVERNRGGLRPSYFYADITERECSAGEKSEASADYPQGSIPHASA
jgi:hypothetical protein